jgi:hypothetical protein
MLKKLGALAASAALAVTLLPAASAQAKATTPGSNVGCYSIKKKGNYNDVRLGVTRVVSGTKVAAYANAMVSASCQKVNSLPIINMYIYWTILSVNGRHVAQSGGVGNGGTKGSIHAQSPFATVPCGARAVVYAKVSYSYYDGSRVRPFVISGPAFRRC